MVNPRVLLCCSRSYVEFSGKTFLDGLSAFNYSFAGAWRRSLMDNIISMKKKATLRAKTIVTKIFIILTGC
jgi:hypothetical protein